MSNDCCTADPGLLSYEQALERLLGAAPLVPGIETVDLRQGLGRVLAEPLVSPVDVPAWDYSAMDGYVLRAADAVSPGTELPVSQRIPAGKAPEPLAPGSAARIFTGAPIPEGGDAVVVQEVCQARGDAVLIGTAAECGANIRRRGEDIRRGSEVLAPGVRLQPHHLGLAASVGVAGLPVRRRLKVAVLASGDELVMPGEPLRPGAIYNSNLFTATGLLQSLGCEVIERGVVADTPEATREAIARAAAEADVVLASGGVSVGEEDHIKPAVEALGRLDIWRLAIRPGKPLAFGWVDGKPFIGTPGNPVSLFVTFVLFARPFILRCMGVADPLPRMLRAAAAFDWPKPDKRREFHRARLESGADGSPEVHVHASRSSGVLSSVAWANGLVVLAEQRVIRRGDAVDFLPFSELLG